jgi:hypothetical protein
MWAVPFWDPAGLSLEALPDNRLGRLDGGQVHLIFDLFERPGTWRAAVPTAVLLWVALNAYTDHPSLLSILFVVCMLGIVGMYAWVLRRLWRDAQSGRVESLCGELTKWEDFDPEGPDLYGLKLGSFSVDLPSQAYEALPKTAHYRIYFTPITGKVVNVDEHADDALHEIPFRASPHQNVGDGSAAVS